MRRQKARSTNGIVRVAETGHEHIARAGVVSRQFMKVFNRNECLVIIVKKPAAYILKPYQANSRIRVMAAFHVGAKWPVTHGDDVAAKCWPVGWNPAARHYQIIDYAEVKFT
ncbi:MAG TPA: hypothetical protein VNV82_04725 [Bryobacteraceae bacterium]|nr:hypothetical protein [Bryobacteraceae bacterium]